jgi:hypothetical protein
LVADDFMFGLQFNFAHGIGLSNLIWNRCSFSTLYSPAQVREDPVNDGRGLDAGDDAQPAAALPAGLFVECEHALDALGPGEVTLAVGGGCRPVLAGRAGSAESGGAGPGHDPRPKRQTKLWASIVTCFFQTTT